MSIGRSSVGEDEGFPFLLGDDDRDDLIGHRAARDGGPRPLMADQGQFILLPPGYPVAGGDVLGRESHVVAVEDLVEAVEDDEIGDLPVGHAHPVSPAGIREGEGGVRHVLHAARDDGLRIACLDGLGGDRDRLHPRGADLVDGDGVGLLGKAREDRGLSSRILSQTRLEDVTHDAFVEIDGCERLGIIVMLLLDLRLIHIPEDIGAAGADGGADLRPEPGPADGFPDDQRTQVDGPYILERSAETADGGPGPAYDDNVSHEHPPPFRVHATGEASIVIPAEPAVGDVAGGKSGYTRISIASPWAAPEQMPQTPSPPPRRLSS